MSSFGRHDYRDPARDKFGKPTISYPDGSLLHPTLTEVFDHRKDSTAGTLPYLSLSQNPRVQGCYLTKQMLTKGDDDSTNLHVIYDRLPGVVKTSYPIDESNGYRMKVQTQVIIAVENPPWLGQRYSAEFTLTEQPSPTETVTVGGTAYTFVDVLSGAAKEVLIGSFLQSTLYNLASAINLDWGIGVNFGTGTTANPNAVAWFSINTLVIADINAPSASVATGTTCANGSWNNSPTSTMVYIEEKEIDANRVERVVTRQIINGDTITSQRLDPDGVAVQIVKQLMSLSAALVATPVEKIAGGTLWVKTTIESFSNGQAFLVTESRVLPGNPIEKEKVLSGTSYETETRTMVQASTITVAETYNSGTGLLTKTENEPITGLVSWKVVTVRPLPGPWIYDYSVDPESLDVIYNMRRKNLGANITPGAQVVSAAAANALLNEGSPTQGSASPFSTQCALLTERRDGRLYADPDEMDEQVSHEVVTIIPLPDNWQETEAIAVHYPEIFQDFDYIQGIGSDYTSIPARPRTVEAIALYFFTVDEGSLPDAGQLVTYGISETVNNPTQLWNPQLASWRLYFDFNAENVFSDPGQTYSGYGPVSGGAIYFSVGIPSSTPSATDYASYVSAGYYVPYQFSSKRWKGNIFINKAVYIPLL